MNVCTRISVFSVLVLSLIACKSQSELDGKYNAMLSEQNAGSNADKTAVQDSPNSSAESPTPNPNVQKGAAETPDVNPVVWKPNYSKSKIAFVGAKVSGQHHGQFDAFDLTAISKAGKPVSVEFSLDMGSVVADEAKLTSHLKSADFFDVANHPKATFISDSVIPTGQEIHEYQVKGKLTLRGMTATIAFPAIVWLYGDYGAATITSEFTINRKAFGIVYPGKVDDLIKDAVLIRLHLELKSPTP